MNKVKTNSIVVLCETLDNERKHRDIKLVKNDKTKYCLVEEANYIATKLILGKLLAIEITKPKIFMNILNRKEMFRKLYRLLKLLKYRIV